MSFWSILPNKSMTKKIHVSCNETAIPCHEVPMSQMLLFHYVPSLTGSVGDILWFRPFWASIFSTHYDGHGHVAQRLSLRKCTSCSYFPPELICDTTSHIHEWSIFGFIWNWSKVKCLKIYQKFSEYLRIKLIPTLPTMTTNTQL